MQRLSKGTGVQVFVPGRPRTKGSLKPVHIRSGAGRCRVSLTESGEYAIAWKKTMIKAIRAACACERWPGPVRVDTFFRFERLTLAETAGESLLKSGEDAWPWPTRETGEYAHGDEDKLRRNALDALTQSGLIFDDALVIGGQNWKRYCRLDTTEPAGVLIVVTPAPMTPAIREREIDALERLDMLRLAAAEDER